MEQYYTPNVAEFHVGFDYELYDHGFQKFIPKKFTFEYVNAVSFALSGTIEIDGKQQHTVRVKRLDHEDILAAGFHFEDENHHGKLYLGKWNNKQDYKLYHTKIGFTTIFNIKPDMERIIFQGVILNASELEFQLNRLNITQ